MYFCQRKMVPKVKEKNIIWINSAKGIAMILIVFAHAQMGYGYVLRAFNNFLMPWVINVFFFLSGYLLYRKQLSEPLIQENGKSYLSGGGKTMFLNLLFRLVIPVMIFSLLEYFPKYKLLGYPMDWERFLFKTIGGGTFWFISALTVAELFTLLLLLTRIRNLWFYVLCSFVVAGVGLYLSYQEIALLPHNYWAYKKGMNAMAFLGLGGLYWKYEKQIDKVLKWYVLLLMAVVYVLLALTFDFTYFNTRMTQMTFVASVFSILIVIKICKRLPENKVVSFIGQNSLGFYLFCGSIPMLLGAVAYTYFPGRWWMIPLLWIVDFVLIYLVVKLIVRWMPWLFDLRRCRNREGVSRLQQDDRSR